MKKMAHPANGDETNSGPQIGCIEVTKVVRDFVPVLRDNQMFGGVKNAPRTFGQLIDDTMKKAASAGEEIQDLTVHITKEYWSEFKAAEIVASMPSAY